jgi:N-acetylneuraminic acid mutarotase
VPVRYAAAAIVGTTIWVFGGEVDGHMVDTVQTVDLTTGRARVAGHLPIRLGHSVVVRLDGHLLLAGGRTDSSTVTGRLWWVRPHPLRLHPAGRLPTPLADSAAVVAGRSAYLVGGEGPAFSDRVLHLRPSP